MRSSQQMEADRPDPRLRCAGSITITIAPQQTVHASHCLLYKPKRRQSTGNLFFRIPLLLGRMSPPTNQRKGFPSLGKVKLRLRCSHPNHYRPISTYSVHMTLFIGVDMQQPFVFLPASGGPRMHNIKISISYIWIYIHVHAFAPVLFACSHICKHLLRIKAKHSK